MSFMDSSLKLGKETKKVKDLAFVKHGKVGATDKKGNTTVVAGEYTFTVGKDSLSYRFKAKGSKTAKPKKAIKSFKELDKLTPEFASEQIEEDLAPTPAEVEVVEEESKQKIESAQSTEEETTTMAKLNLEGKHIEIPAAAEAALKDLGVTGPVIELPDFDQAIVKASGKNLEVLSEFEETITDLLDAGDTPAPPAEAVAAEQETPTPTTPGPMGSNIFNDSQAPSRTAPQTDKEREEARALLAQKREDEERRKKENIGRIEELRQKTAEFENGTEAIESLQELMLINGQLPLFRTLVPSDTRLRAFVRDTVPAGERVYHPSLQGNPAHTEVGKNIPLKLSHAQYEVEMRESNPSQPTGYFVYIPEALMDFKPSEITYSSERARLLKAKETGAGNLVIKYYPKAELVNLLLLLKADLVLYDATREAFVETSPRIKTKVTQKEGLTTYSLTAVDHEGARTKLSIRHFIPVQTHNTARKSEVKLQEVSDAIFAGSLMKQPNGAPAAKITMLVPDSMAKFSKNPDGTYVYNQFQDSQSVLAYDSTAKEPRMIDMPLPKVEMSKPSASTGISRPVFVRTRHSNPGYLPEYQPLVDAVGDEINKIRKATNKAIINSQSQELARLEGVTSLLQGENLNIK